MSVLNTMLRDLERRGASPRQRPAAAEAQPIAPGAAAVSHPQARSNRRVVRRALLLAAAAAALATYWLWPRPAPLTHRAATQAAASVPASAAPATAAPAAPAVNPPAATTPAPATVEPAPVEPGVPHPARVRAPKPVAPPKSAAALATAEAAAEPAAASAEAPAVAHSAARSDLARALELADRGRTADATRLLATAVSQRPDWSDARSALAALQADAGDRRQALATLLEGVPIDPARFAPTAAQLQAELGDPAGALSTLDRVPAGHRDPAYHALAAAVAQRAGRHDLAVAEYGATLRSAPDNAAAWVGLGVSLQALGRNEQALAAYQGAARVPLGADLRRFVETRIRALRAVPALTPAPLPHAGEGN